MKTLTVLTVTALIIALSIMGIAGVYQQRKLNAMQEELTLIKQGFLATTRDSIAVRQTLEKIEKATAPKPAIKESANRLASTLTGRTSLFYVKKTEGNDDPQFRKIGAFLTAINSFSSDTHSQAVSITPIGSIEMIDGEPAYTAVLVTHVPSL
jgi:hypothetical protein